MSTAGMAALRLCENAGGSGSRQYGRQGSDPHIQYLIGSENKMLDKAARWAVGCLGGAMPSKAITRLIDDTSC